MLTVVPGTYETFDHMFCEGIDKLHKNKESQIYINSALVEFIAHIFGHCKTEPVADRECACGVFFIYSDGPTFLEETDPCVVA